jgi:hypothetical protein
MKIKKWKDLDRIKNDRYLIWVDQRQIYVRILPDDDITKWSSLTMFIPDFTTEEIIGILKSVGFNVEFIKSPLEQVKEYLNHKKSNIKKLPTQDSYSSGYTDGELSILNGLLYKIERIEKDD